MPTILLALYFGCDGPAADRDDSGPSVKAATCDVTVTCEGNIIDEPKAPCTVQVADSAGETLYTGPAGVELRGRTSLTFPKPQYNVELRDWSELPVWPGSIWRYNTDGDDLGTAWRDPGYDDSGWATGGAPLGYGQPYLVTELDATSESPVTTYMRYEFTPASAARITRPRLGVMRDDGAAVYLNGTEIFRTNLADGAAHDDLATVAVETGDDTRWYTTGIDPTLLVEGLNVLAVELHQADPDDTDLRFDLYLEGSGEEVGVDILGMGEDSDWILNGMYLDRVLFRNKLAFDLFQEFGGPQRYATEGRYCEVVLNDEYQGVYSLGEKIERSSDRIDIQSANDGNSFIVKLDDQWGFYPNSVGYGEWQLVYPEDEAAEVDVAAYLAEWETALLGPDPGNLFQYLDLGSTVDWILLEEFMKNHDAYNLSVHFWKDIEGKMYLTPWDLDLSMGYPYTDCGATGWAPRYPYIEAIADVPEFHDALVARWAELRAGPLAEDTILARIGEYDTTLGDAVARNFEKWPIDDIKYTTDFEDDWLCPVESYEEEHERVLTFIHDRLEWMDTNIQSF